MGSLLEALTLPRRHRAHAARKASRWPRGLAVESLETRLNLSTLAAAVPMASDGAAAQDVSTIKRYRIDSFASQTAPAQTAGAQAQTASASVTPTYGQSWTNPNYTAAQIFFNRFKNSFVNPTPGPTPAPAPAPAPTPPPAPVGPPVAIAENTMGNFTELAITGTSGNDSIVVSQSGSTFTIVANGNTSTISGNFTELAIYGGAGNDTITVQSSVNIESLLYGGDGSNTLTALGSVKSYIVAIGNAGGVDTLTGNGVNTSYWADTGDTVNASSAEAAAGDVHRIASFYQPFTNSPSNSQYISTTLNGPNLPDPTDSGSTTRLNAMLWGSGPVMTDINQGQVGDCYFLASIQSLALKQPARLQEMAVDLGDGTYAVEFQRGGTQTYVRVDGDLPTAPWGGLYYAHPSNGGAIWGAIMEKAYAFFRSGSNTYDSLNSGWTGSVFSDLGVMTTTFSTSGSGLFGELASALANGKAVAAVTNGTIPSNIPIIGGHAYSVVSTSVSNGTQYITVRNPWGFDGAGNDGNPNDGLVTITLAQFNTAFAAGSIMV